MTWLHYQAAVHDTDHRKTDECGSGSAVAVEIARHAANVSGGPSIPGMYRRAAEYVDKIARGANTTDLPIEQPTGFEFIINLKTAKLIGKELPTSILLRADEVIE